MSRKFKDVIGSGWQMADSRWQIYIRYQLSAICYRYPLSAHLVDRHIIAAGLGSIG